MRPMARAAFALAAVALLAGVGAVASSLARPPPPATAFAASADGAWPLVQDARAVGVDVQRVVSSPAAALRGVDPSRTALAVFASREAYSAHEVAAVQRFVQEGGRLLVADPFGTAGALAAPFGLGFERVRLVDPAAPNGTRPASLDGATFQVAWTNPSAVRVAPGTPARALALSSPASFLDRDGDGVIDAADPQGQFPLAAAIAPEGGGLVAAVADRGAFLQATSGERDNALWRQALLQHLLPEGGRLLVDESHQADGHPVTRTVAAWSAAAAAPSWSRAFVALALAFLLVPLLPAARRMLQGHRFRPDRFVRRRELAMPAAETRRARDGPAWTARGWGALGAAGALVVGGQVSGSPQAIGAGAVLIVALAAALLQPAAAIEAWRTLSTQSPREGSPIEATLWLKARGRRSRSVDIEDRVPEEFEVTTGQSWFRARVAAGSPQKVTYAVTPALRGPYEVGPLVARTHDVLGLRTRSSILAAPQEVQVAPRQESVRRIPFTTRVPTVTLGPHHVNRAGDGSEFHALRDYVTGDSMRSVNWKASARAGGLMVNQRVHESMTKLTILLDARSVSGAGPARRTPLAVGCRVAFSIAAGALRVRDRITIAAYGEGLQRLPDAPGSRQLHLLRGLLSSLPARGATPLMEAVEQLGTDIRPKMPVLVVSGLEGDPTVVEAVRALRNRGALPVVIAPPVTVDAEDGPDGEDAQQILRGRDEAVRGLRALGVPVYETAEGLPLDDLFRIGGGP